MKEETICHLFYYCNHIQDIWNQVQAYFTDSLHFLQLTPQTAIFGFYNIDNNIFKITNYFCSNYIYTMPWNTGFYLLTIFKIKISKIKNSEGRVPVSNQNKCERFRKKWQRTENKVP